MTNTAEMIVTELQNGPASARELSQRMNQISYANIRQILCRLFEAGTVSKLKRGVYQLASSDRRNCSEVVHNSTMTERQSPKFTTVLVQARAKQQAAGSRSVPACHLLDAVQEAWEDYYAMNDPFDYRAWL